MHVGHYTEEFQKYTFEIFAIAVGPTPVIINWTVKTVQINYIGKNVNI